MLQQYTDGGNIKISPKNISGSATGVALPDSGSCSMTQGILATKSRKKVAPIDTGFS